MVNMYHIVVCDQGHVIGKLIDIIHLVKGDSYADGILCLWPCIGTLLFAMIRIYTLPLKPQLSGISGSM